MKILKNSKIYLAISGVFLFISLGLLTVSTLNLGIDMTGGIQMEYSHEAELDIEKIKSEVSTLASSILNGEDEAINNTSVYTITGKKSLVVVAGFRNGIEDVKLEELKNNFRSQSLSLLQGLDVNITETKYVNIGKSFGDYIKNTAFLTLAIAIIAITIYVTWAFSGVVGGISVASFAVITVLTLFHDVVISSGLYIFAGKFFPEFQIDTFFITALLTILGYSINDTIVVFDRIRANLKQFGGKKGKDGKNLEDIVDLSITETFTRSIYTSLTLLFVLVTIFFFGPETIKGFVLVMIFGTVVGTYSSIFIASPILYIANKNKRLTVYKKEIKSAEDKMVV